eukprot:TRINITY_DN12106_c0_g1_i2.p1 TRINITY_DN12106_c0_g1~~TRINITY_DN12106_c0_g1_i2.p1  ORF type:complete len:417 (+),score=110.73 TRINITY_DN12106_c0_g1_i2:62-1312(+)
MALITSGASPAADSEPALATKSAEDARTRAGTSPSTTPGSESSSPSSSPLFVRNTFIDEIGRHASLEGFFEERATQSCPASREVSFDDVGIPPGLLEAMAAEAHAQVQTRGVSELPRVEEESPQAERERSSSKPSQLEDVVSPLPVRNTFIDERVERSVSLEGFFQERAVRSCPVSREVSVEDGGVCAAILAAIEEACPSSPAAQQPPASQPGAPATPQLWPAAAAPGAAAGMPADLAALFAASMVHPPTPPPSREAAGANLAAPNIPPPPAHCAPVLSMTATPPPPPVRAPGDGDASGHAPLEAGARSPAVQRLEFGPQQKREVQLSAVLPEPELGSPAYPSLGSREHHSGGCRPCAFLHTKGCTNAENCSFCHLCPAGERKARKKERKAQSYLAAQQAKEIQALEAMVMPLLPR